MALQPHNKARSLILDAVTPFIIVLVFGGVVVPSFLYLLQPEMNKYFPGSKFHIDTQADMVKARETYLVALRAFSELYKEKGLGADSDISTLVPSGGKTDELFGHFEAAGKKVGASLQIIDIARAASSKTASKENIQEISVTLKYEGLDYETLKKLLSYFEMSKRFTDVTSFSFDPIARFASFTVKVYYMREKK